MAQSWPWDSQIAVKKKQQQQQQQLNGLKINNIIVNNRKSTATEFNEFFGEIEKIINMFSEKKAVGPHRISTNILTKYKKIPSIPLFLIINISFKTCIFPEFCKVAHVIPV